MPMFDQLLGLLRGEQVTRSSLANLLVTQTVVFLLQAILNKSALVDLPAPLLLLLIESFITSASVYGGYWFGWYDLRAAKNPTHTLRALRWLIAAKVVSAVTRTYCVEAVDGAVFNLVRGLVLPFAVILSAFFLDRKPSTASLVPVIVICMGFYVGTFSEHSDLTDVGGSYGVTIGALSSFFAALDLTVTKTSLDTHSIYDILFVTNAGTVIVTLPMILLGSEYGDHLTSDHPVDSVRLFILKAIVCGLLTFIAAVLALLQLNLTSPITHQITTSARGILQSLFSVILLGELMEWPQILSIAIILIGTLAYTIIKELEQRAGESRETADGLLEKGSGS
ncbi:hypothetical protein PYCC9005_004979 [Savitreella phatthalungensis]